MLGETTRGNDQTGRRAAGPGREAGRVLAPLGRTVATLAGGTLGAGTHHAEVPVASLAPGVYVVRAVVGGTVQTARLTVAR